MITLSKEKDRAKMNVVLPEKMMPKRLYGGGGDLLPHPSTLSLNDSGPKVERAGALILIVGVSHWLHEA